MVSFTPAATGPVKPGGLADQDLRARRRADAQAQDCGQPVHDWFHSVLREQAPQRAPWSCKCGQSAPAGKAVPGQGVTVTLCTICSAAPYESFPFALEAHGQQQQPDGSGTIRIRGARQHNLKNLDLDIRTGEMTVVTGPERLGQVQPGVRHAVRRGPAALRRDLQRLRAPVPRPHGPPGGRPRRRRAAGHRDRPDQPGAQLALDGRHDDRAERPPEAAVRARRRAVRQADRAARAARLAGDDLRRADGAHAATATRAWSSPSRSSCRPTPAPSEVEQWLAASGFTRVQAEREVASPTGPRKLLDVVADRFRLQGTEKVRAVEAIEMALKRGSGRVNVYALKEEGEPRPVALLHRPALPRQRPALRRPAAGAVQLQLGLRRLRHLPRLRPRDRRRLRPGDPRPPQDAAQRRDQADADAGLEGVPGRPDASTAARPASRATRRGRSSPRRSATG